MLGVSALSQVVVLKQGHISQNVDTVLNNVTGGLLIIGVYSGAAMYWCDYWSESCRQLAGDDSFSSITKQAESANVTVRTTWGMSWFFIGFR